VRYVHRLLRASILGESVTRGDHDSIAKVKELFTKWSEHNDRFVRRSMFYPKRDSDIEILFRILDTCVMSPGPALGMFEMFGRTGPQTLRGRNIKP